jgi:hypothetical protein
MRIFVNGKKIASIQKVQSDLLVKNLIFCCCFLAGNSLGLEQGNQPSKGVMRWNAIGQF